MAQYKLREKDLDGLHFVVSKSASLLNPSFAHTHVLLPRRVNAMGYRIDTHLYSEMEVERRAWERYGGPEAFEAL